MELLDKIVETNPNLYFIEGFYDKHFLIIMTEKVKEVKVSLELLSLIRESHDKKIPIASAIEKILGDNTDNDRLSLIEKHISWLSEKGVIRLV